MISEERLEQMEILSILEKLSFPMDDVGTYFFKDMIVKARRYLSGTDDFNGTISQKELSDLQERIIVAQQVANGIAGKAGISAEKWVEVNDKKRSSEISAQEIISGEATNRTFHVNGIMASVTAKDGLVTISALGGKDVLQMENFAADPRSAINAVVQNMAINKYMCYICDKIPDMLCTDSKYFQNVADGKVKFTEPDIRQTEGGRPIAAIPDFLSQDGAAALGATIKINANSGEISWVSKDTDAFGPAMS